jgi:chemotaxis protein methyltransferase CheR
MTTADDALRIQELCAHASSWTGNLLDESLLRAVLRVVVEEKAKGESLEGLGERARRNDPELVALVVASVSVPETYFFRQPEHFEQIERLVLPELSDGERIRAWSAGCATGEETYSLAACLLAKAPPSASIDVLGTDLSQKNIDKAQTGGFGAWSLRGPLLYPLFAPGKAPGLEVDARVREVTRFYAHTVLAPLTSEPPFHLVLCRNVLLYFSPSAAHVALRHLTEAVAPGGFILFGTLDVQDVPDELVRVGPPEANIFRRSRRRMTAPPPRARSDRPSPVDVTVVAHERALGLIDAGDRRGAARLLEELLALAPDYVPGLFEVALLHRHAGHEERAVESMRGLLRRIESFPDDTLLGGPHDLTVHYYRVAAGAFLGTRTGRWEKERV